MKRVLKLAGLLLFFGVTRAKAVDLTVNVKNEFGVPLAGVQVCAIHFSTFGPDPSASKFIAATNASGVATFTGGTTLNSGLGYEVFVSSNGFLPSIREQFDSPARKFVQATGTPSPVNIVLSSATAPKVGEVNLTVTNAASSLLFGDVRFTDGSDAQSVAFGVGTTSGGNGTIRIFNVPFASSFTYTIGIFDPNKGEGGAGVGTMVDQTLAAYQTVISYAGPFDFNGAPPPQRSVSADATTGAGGSLSYDGILLDNATNKPIANVGVNFEYKRKDQYCQTGCNSNLWSHADENGRFQFYGLELGTTYYAKIFGACDWRTSTCYEGATSTVTVYGNAPGENDFLYTGSPISRQIKLKASTGGSGKLAVYIKSNTGFPIPQAGVGLWPDWNQWGQGGQCSVRVSSPGIAQANVQATTGYALISNLPSGNYQIQAWTQFSQNGMGDSFNSGPDRKQCWQQSNVNNPCDSCITDDYRLTLSTTTGLWTVFNGSGTALQVNLSSITIIVNVSTQSLVGLVKGTLTFPLVNGAAPDLRNDPINITLQPNCGPGGSGGPCTGGGFTVIDAAPNSPSWTFNSTKVTIPYSINVSTGRNYWMNVTSNYWGQVRTHGGGSDQVKLDSTGTVHRDITFAPAGRLVGKLYKPGNVLFLPTFSQGGAQANINLNSEGAGWGWGQVNQDGSYAIGGLLPGTYKIRVQGWGNFPYANPTTPAKATIYAGRDTVQDSNVVHGVALKMSMDLTKVAPLPTYDCTGQNGWNCPPERWVVKPLPAGSVFGLERIASMLVHDEEDAEFEYIPNPGSDGPCHTTQPGFCVKRVPSPNAFDFRLLRAGKFDDHGNSGMRPYFVILHSTFNFKVDQGLVSAVPYFDPAQFSSITVQHVDMTPPVSQFNDTHARLKGNVFGQNILRQVDFQGLGGNFQNFIKFIPVVTLSDSSDTLNAAGLVTPTPSCFNQPAGGNYPPGTLVMDVFDQAIAAGDWTKFNSVFGSGGPCYDSSAGTAWAYEIRGLTPGKKYTAVIATPNYPPYTTSVTLGAANTTTTLDFNLDQLVGSGATLTGVVRSTDATPVAIPNAQVSIAVDGFKKNPVTTDATGTYKFEGLPPGTYKIKVTASGYVTARQEIDISGTSTFTQNFSLKRSGSSIRGTVYLQRWPPKTPAGVHVFAYNDTQNANDANSVLDIVRTVTSSSGTYALEGLETGVTYKIFVKAPGKWIESKSTLTVAGIVSGIDFDIKSKPLQLQSFGNASLDGLNYEFTIIYSSTAYKDGRVWIGPSPFVVNQSTEVSDAFQEMPGDEFGNSRLVLKYPLASLTACAASDCTLHIEAIKRGNTTGVADTVKDLVFNLSKKAHVTQDIDDKIIGDDTPDSLGRKGNEALLDNGGSDPSAIVLPAGSMIASSNTAIPAVEFTKLDLGASTATAMVNAGNGQASFLSGVFQIAFSSVNYTQKGIDLTLAYDKDKYVSGDVALHHYNTATNKWEMVPGLQTLDPVKGTIKVKKLKSLSSVLGLKNGHPMLAQNTGKGGYRPNATYRPMAVVDSGAFAIMRVSLVGGSYTGTTLKVYNFPNPFNLNSKSVTLADPGTNPAVQTINGTMIKYQLPPGISGRVYIRIYTINGELVRELDQGDQTGGATYYTSWDGTNRTGKTVANGVYYGVLSVPGTKAKDGTFKMAVIK